MKILPLQSAEADVIISSLRDHISMRKNILTPEEQEIRKYLLNSFYNTGYFPDFENVAKIKNIPLNDVLLIIKKLDNLDALSLNEDGSKISVFYPFNINETIYSIIPLENTKLIHYANCAIDALGIPFMYNKNIKIKAKSILWKKEIELTIENGAITNMNREKIYFFGGTTYCQKAVNSVCGVLVFCSSIKELNEWKKEKGNPSGKVLSIEEALYVAKIIFQNRLKTNEI